jgi:hypothetical protein
MHLLISGTQTNGKAFRDKKMQSTFDDIKNVITRVSTRKFFDKNYAIYKIYQELLSGNLKENKMPFVIIWASPSRRRLVSQ